jgi:hypothetical protein
LLCDGAPSTDHPSAFGATDRKTVGLPPKNSFSSQHLEKSVKGFNKLFHSSFVNRRPSDKRYSFALTKNEKMKKTMVAAALLLLISTTRASETRKHSDEHNILSTELPVALQSSIKTAYSGYWITELTEEGKDKHAKYTLTLENADQILHLRADKGDSWEVVSTTVKGE